MIFYTGLALLTVASATLIGIYRACAIKVNMMDVPNERSSHLNHVPLGSGIVFIGLWAVYGLINFYQNKIPLQDLYALIVPTLCISVIGLLDDKLKLAARIRFSLYSILATFSIVAVGGYPEIFLGEKFWHLGAAGAIFAIITTVWSANLYNFMDGLDGFAAVEAIFIYSIGGYLLWCANGYALALLCWGMVASVVGYLKWNWPNARVFMGDAGSVSLGFLIVPISIVGERLYQVPALLWMIPYSLFLVDSGLTLYRRVRHKEELAHAHRKHAYQRLYQSGWSKINILKGTIAINSILSLLTLLANQYQRFIVPMVFIALFLCTHIYFLIEKKQPMYPFAK